jgi:hypothetical protein
MFAPLPFDVQYLPKPSFDSLVQAFQGITKIYYILTHSDAI